MNLYQLLFVILISAVFALLEIQIEGSGGWAENLPTWRIKNPFKKIVSWPTLVDGYHLWMWVFIILFFHIPYIFGFPFTKANEFLIAEMILLFMFLEDFLWFLLNPAWGFKNFFTKEIPWHSKKILFLPQNYWLSFIIFGAFEIIKHRFS